VAFSCRVLIFLFQEDVIAVGSGVAKGGRSALGGIFMGAALWAMLL